MKHLNLLAIMSFIVKYENIECWLLNPFLNVRLCEVKDCDTDKLTFNQKWKQLYS